MQINIGKRENFFELPNAKIKKEDLVSIKKKVIPRYDNDPHIYANLPYQYINVSNFIYKVKPFPNDLEYVENIENLNDYVGLTQDQVENISPSNDADNMKSITILNFTTYCIPVDTVIISIDVNILDSEVIIKKTLLTEFISEQLISHIVSIKQSFSFIFRNKKIKCCIDKIDNEKHGKILKSTKIILKNKNENDKCIIYDKCIVIDAIHVNIEIDKYILLDQQHIIYCNPAIILDQKIISQYIKNIIPKKFSDNIALEYQDNNVKIFFTVKIIKNNDLKLKLNNNITNNNIINIIITDNNTTNNKITDNNLISVFKLNKKHDILNINSKIDNLIIVNETIIASKIIFIILPCNNQQYNLQDYTINKKKIDELIKKIDHVVVDQEYYMALNNKMITIKIDKVYPYSNCISKYLINSEKTKIKIRNSGKFTVYKGRAKAIKNITYKIKKEIDRNYMLNLQCGLIKKIEIDTSKLKKIIKDNMPKKLLINQMFNILYNKNDIIVKIDNINFLEKNNDIDKLTPGYLTDTTKIKFIFSHKLPCNIINSDDNISKKKKMNTYIGGLDNEIKTLSRTITLSHGKMKDEFLARNLKPIKGIILYGPPGTGKTSIARCLGNMIGCTGERLKYVSGPEIFNKWVGESEAKIRELFKPAKTAWKKYGSKSPTFMIIIDEIDSILPPRTSDMPPWANSIVAQFLSEMDGLEQNNNIICIGTTNRLDDVDPAILRPGRFGTHIQIGLPDKKARIDIFNIYTKKLKKKNKLDNINLHEIANLTEKCSGADIEHIVNMASLYSLERLSELSEINENINNEKGLITNCDFIRAINEFKNKPDNNIENISCYI